MTFSLDSNYIFGLVLGDKIATSRYGAHRALSDFYMSRKDIPVSTSAIEFNVLQIDYILTCAVRACRGLKNKCSADWKLLELIARQLARLLWRLLEKCVLFSDKSVYGCHV